jgi:hypothetical protein
VHGLLLECLIGPIEKSPDHANARSNASFLSQERLHLLDRQIGFVFEPGQQKIAMRIELRAARPTLPARSYEGVAAAGTVSWSL